MKKNVKVFLRIDSETFNRIKRNAEEEEVNFSEYCRRMLKSDSRLTSIERVLESIDKKLNTQLNTKQEVTTW